MKKPRRRVRLPGKENQEEHLELLCGAKVKQPLRVILKLLEARVGLFRLRHVLDRAAQRLKGKEVTAGAACRRHSSLGLLFQGPTRLRKYGTSALGTSCLKIHLLEIHA